MSQTFDERFLRFRFDDEWSVIQYDKHTCYLNGVERLNESKGVDFVALHHSSGRREPFLIEVKEFRGYRIQNKKRLSNGELAIEIGQKVRDTVAGLMGAVRRESEPKWLRPLVNAMGAPQHPVKVVLFLEEDSTTTHRQARAPGRHSTLGKQLTKALRWLKVHVVVESRASSGLPGVTVSSLPGAPP